jgi:hypothetical protein
MSAEPIPVTDDQVLNLLLAEKITQLEDELKAEREVSAHWKWRAEEGDRRIADLETERFAR